MALRGQQYRESIFHPIDAAEEDRVVETLVRCARGD